MPELKINLANLESVQTGLTILQAIVVGGGKLAVSALNVVETVTGRDLNSDGMIGGEEVIDPGDPGEDDGLGELFPEDVPEVPDALSIDDVKDAVTALIKSKGREAAKSLVTKALAKLKVAKLEEVPEEKYETLIAVMKKAAA